MAGSTGKHYNMVERGANKKTMETIKTGGRSKNKLSERNWDLLREEWVTTNVSLSGLAYKYEIPICTVRKHYYNHDWKSHLAEYNSMVDKSIDEARKAKAQHLAERIVDLDEVVMSVSERIVEIVEENLSKLSGEKERRSAKDVISVLKTASDTLKNAHYNIRLSGDKATGIIDTNSEVNFNNSEEENERIRLEYEHIFKGSPKDKPVRERKLSQAMDSNESSQDTQE